MNKRKQRKQVIVALRQAGLSYTQIGEELGISRQSAHYHYHGRPDRPHTQVRQLSTEDIDMQSDKVI